MVRPTAFCVAVRRTSGDVTVVEASGELDYYTSPKFSECLMGAVEEGALGVVVDLAAVTFIDSSALGVLVGGARRTAELRRELMIVCPAGSVARVLEITGLNRAFAIYATREEALDAAVGNKAQ
jgi:anti-sigma B factor antagonist